MKTLGIFSGKQNTRGARHWKAESSRAAQLACGRAANLYLPAEKVVWFMLQSKAGSHYGI